MKDVTAESEDATMESEDATTESKDAKTESEDATLTESESESVDNWVFESEDQKPFVFLVVRRRGFLTGAAACLGLLEIEGIDDTADCVTLAMLFCLIDSSNSLSEGTGDRSESFSA